MSLDQRLRQLFFLLVVRPLLALVIGLNVRHPERLPRVRAVAAADYFLRHRALACFSRRMVDTIGEPETLGRLRSGIAHLLQRRPRLLATPVFLQGLGKSLPRGEALLVPFFCDVAVGSRSPGTAIATAASRTWGSGSPTWRPSCPPRGGSEAAPPRER